MSTEEKTGFLNEILEIIKILFTALLLAIIIVQFIRPTRVDGVSMYPTLENNDYLIINRVTRYTGVKRGAVVVFDSNLPIKEGPYEKSDFQKVMDTILQDDSNTKDLVKRVVAIGGDHIVIKDGVVSINGKAIDEPYISKDNYTQGDIDTVVPENEYFCMGDNRMRSFDSRYPDVGFVPKNKLVGSVLVRLLPVSHAGRVR